jgi:hypothetical protein
LGWIEPFPEFKACLQWFLKNRKELVEDVVHQVTQPDGRITYVLTIVNANQLSCLLDRAWNSDEFLSSYGLRSLSKAHQTAPFEFDGKYVGYEPGEAVSKLKGGNSNWRGPIWFPTCFLLIEALRKLGQAYGPQFTVTPPARDGEAATFSQLARDMADRLIRIFLRDNEGRRPVYGGCRTFQDDPYWKDHLLFYEYFHGDTGAGLGASHQTGWTALVASLIDEWRR